MKIKTLLTVLMLGIFGSAIAVPEDRGFYVGTGVGEAKADDAGILSLTDGTDTAFRLFGGYEFSRYLAAEVGYLDFGHFNGTRPIIEFESSARFELDGFSVGLRPQWMLGNRWFVQAQLGIFHWASDADIFDGPFGGHRETDHGDDLYWGVGVGRSLAGAWRLSGEWTRFEIDDSDADLLDESDVDFLNLVISYRFGK